MKLKIAIFTLSKFLLLCPNNVKLVLQKFNSKSVPDTLIGVNYYMKFIANSPQSYLIA